MYNSVGKTEIVVDTCVVIKVMESPSFAKWVRDQLKGKSIRVILLDVVCREAKKVRGFEVGKLVERLRKLLGREVGVVSVGKQHIEQAKSLSSRYHMCHNGDNRILAFCRDRSVPLVTSDANLRKVSEWAGVASFRPSEMDGI